MAIKFKRLISNKRSLPPKHKLCDHSVISLEVKNNYHLKSCEAKHYQLSSLFSPKPSCMAFKMCSILFSWSTYYQILQFFFRSITCPIIIDLNYQQSTEIHIIYSTGGYVMNGQRSQIHFTNFTPLLTINSISV